MERVYNFSAGPSMMPVPVLEKAAEEMVCYPGAGCSVMEMSHRSNSYMEIISQAESDLRSLMNISDDYSVLFLQGGASLQFSMVPMNLAKRGETMDYIVSGQFAKKAFQEGKRWGNAVCLASSEADTYAYIPEVTKDMLSPDAKFLHITGNNTIYGTTYQKLPETGDIPLVCDLSSIILGKEFNVNDFGLIYAGAQKNMGPAGLTVVIIRKDLISDDLDSTVPTMLRYKIHADADSMYNTPPCYSIYIAGLVYKWVKEMGGVAEMEKRNVKKAALLYDYLDSTDFYVGAAQKEYRSIMNVTFTLAQKELTDDFIAMAKNRGLINIKGHRSVGGCRASIYNAMPYEGVEALVQCMKDFEKGDRK